MMGVFADMAYFENDFDNLFNELNSSFFNDDFGRRSGNGNSGSIPINYSSNMSSAPQTWLFCLCFA